jgi:hypothetical protein
MNPEQPESADFKRVSWLWGNSPDERSEFTALLAQLSSTQRATCPMCGATTIQIVNIQKKDVGKAMLAEWLLDSTAAGVAAGSSTLLSNACVACGFQWIPGSPPEALARVFSGQLGTETRQRLLARLEQRDQTLTEQQQTRTRYLGIFFALLVGGVTVALVYNAYFSPEGRAQAADLKRTEAWVNCVIRTPPRSKPDCGPPVSRASLYTWFDNGHYDVGRNLPVRARLERLTVR